MRVKKLSPEERMAWVRKVFITPATRRRIELLNVAGEIPAPPAKKKATTERKS